MESRSSIMRISDTKILQLIELYQNEECLWNTDLPKYKNRRARYAAAQLIAEKLAVEKFDARHVIMKIKNLRNYYCQELKKIATSAAFGEKPVYRPRVIWFELMDAFLRPHLQQIHPWDYGIEQKEQEEEVSLDGLPTEFVALSDTEEVVIVKEDPDEEDSDPVQHEEEPDPVRHEEEPNPVQHKEEPDPVRHEEEPNPVQHEEEPNPVLHEEEPNPLQHEEESYFKRGIRRKFLDEDSNNSSVFGYNQNAKRPAKGQPSADCFDTFGKYVSSMLRLMPRWKAAELQPKIVAMLTAVDLDDVDELASRSDETL